MTNNFESTIPQRIKKTNMSIREFSEVIGISRPTVTLLARGEMPVRNTEYIFAKLCEFFDCQLSDLFVYRDA